MTALADSRFAHHDDPGPCRSTTAAMSMTRSSMKAAALARRASAGPYVAATLREIDATLALAIPRVVGHLDDEVIHDLRVAIRRMRTLLTIARPIFGRFTPTLFAVHSPMSSAPPAN